MFETMEMEIEQLLSKVCLVYIPSLYSPTLYEDNGKCFKISNTFLFLLSTKMLAIMAGIQNAYQNSKQGTKKQSDLGLHCLQQLAFDILEHLLYSGYLAVSRLTLLSS